MRVDRILQGSMMERVLFPESISHLLHQDLAYLWVLSTLQEYRPSEWEYRVDGWRRLLGLFLLGRLRVVRTPIQQPLLARTKPLGIHAVDELWLADAQRGDAQEPVGVLSPVVLVRPLPDATPESLGALPDPLKQHPGPLTYFGRLLETTLDSLAAESGRRPIHEGLAFAVRETVTMWTNEVRHSTAVHYRPREQRCRLFRYIDFAGPDPDDGDDVPIFIWGGGSTRLFVPRCGACNALLTREDGQNVVVTVQHAEYVALDCPDGHGNDIELERFLLWRRAQGEVVCWTDRKEMSPGDEDQLFPPAAQVQGETVRFSWETADVDLEPHRRHLVLRFPNCRVSALSFQSVFYEELVVPDKPPNTARFQGIPIRGDWCDAWAGVQELIADPHGIFYGRVRLRGVPFGFHRSYGPARLRWLPQALLCVYPKPMHTGWHLYRAMISGLDADELGAAAGASQAGDDEWRVLADGLGGPVAVARDVSQWPRFVSLENRARDAGATWNLAAVDGALPKQFNATLSLGIDFGTTNTVLYFNSTGPDPITTKDNALQLRAFDDLVYWVHPPAADVDHAGWILPVRTGWGHDPSLIPSALWTTPDRRFGAIRWSPRRPTSHCTAAHGFKWDEGMEDRQALRALYLQELLRFALPIALEKLGARGATPQLSIGFAYPLAFSDAQVERYKRLFDDLREWLRQEAGLRATLFVVNESMASLRALGAFQPGEVFLIADMGGRTLDVALFTEQRGEIKREHVHQIGSVDFGGEAFLHGVLQAQDPRAPRAALEGAPYWELRDRLADPAQRSGFMDDGGFADRMERFHTLGLEFVRTMAEAWLHDRPQGRAISILLVGNGWRLRALMEPDRDAHAVCVQYFEGLIDQFGNRAVRHLVRQLPGIDFSKHWVALGALNVALHATPINVEADALQPRLPAGRRLAIAHRTTEWWQNEGGGSGRRFDMPLEAARAAAIDVEYLSGPSTPASWQAFLDVAVPPARRYPPAEVLRDLLIRALRSDYLSKGPLTLIIENQWKAELCR